MRSSVCLSVKIKRTEKTCLWDIVHVVGDVSGRLKIKTNDFVDHVLIPCSRITTIVFSIYFILFFIFRWKKSFRHVLFYCLSHFIFYSFHNCFIVYVTFNLTISHYVLLIFTTIKGVTQGQSTSV